MMMKLLFLACTMALTMSAQDFNGVSIGGDVSRPTIVNNSPKPIMHYIVQENYLGGGGVDQTVLHMERMIKGTFIQPGEEVALGISKSFHPATDRAHPEADLIGYAPPVVESRELIAVLFADGSFTGPEYARQALSTFLYRFRSLARDTQYLPDKYRVMEADRAAARERADFTNVERATLAHFLLVIREEKGEAESEAALARLAAMSDVEKGEQQ